MNKTNKELKMTSKEQSPEVVAYRVGELERKTTGGFAALNKKLDDYLNTFTTKSELEEVKKQAKEDLDEFKESVKDDYVTKSEYASVKSKVTGLFWVLGILGTAIIAVLGQRLIAWLLSGALQ